MGAKPSEIVTRFAPSPTGFLHIGGARTALFNLLYARRYGGRFLLRIEDTDRARSTEPAIAAILDGLRWLDFAWDGEPVMQFARSARHAEVAHGLVDAGFAYRCWMSQVELAAARAEAEAARRPFRLASLWRDRTDGPADQPFVVRLKAPRDGEVTIDDQVQGAVTVSNAELDDFVLLRSDGTPTYMLAVVVDDADMAVTHVIRGDDHLNNAFRQLALIRAAGFPEPTYAHLPLIHGPDGTKLSKRHGALGVDAYRDELGILPEALENYLLRLGWGHGDDEIISREQAIQWFDLAHVGRGPSRTDDKKLRHVNKHYLKHADDARLTALAVPRLELLLGRPLHRDEPILLQRTMAELKVRANDLNDLGVAGLFLFRTRPLKMDEGAAKLLDPTGRDLLAAARETVAAADWAHDPLESVVKALADARGLGLGKVAQPLRAALTGTTTSPGIFDVLMALGREESLGRIDDALGGNAERG